MSSPTKLYGYFFAYGEYLPIPSPPYFAFDPYAPYYGIFSQPEHVPELPSVAFISWGQTDVTFGGMGAKTFHELL